MKRCEICKREVVKQDAGDDTPHCPNCDRIVCHHHQDKHACDDKHARGQRWIDNCPPVVAK